MRGTYRTRKRPFLLTLLIFAVTGIQFTTFAQSPIRVVVRVDDIQSRNTTTVPRSILPFQQAVEARGGKVTWLTIPHRLVESQNANGILLQELRSSAAAGHEVGQHGYTHICQRCGNSGHEMWCATTGTGFTAAQQRTLVQDGTRILMDSVGVRPRAFVSPGHHEDSVTYDVLSANGFRYISTTRHPAGSVGAALYNIPSGTDFTWQLTSQTYSTKLNQALAEARRVCDATGVYVVLFHDPFIRSGYENGLVVRWTGAFLDSLVATYGSRLQILTLTQTIQQILSPDAPSCRANIKLILEGPFNAGTGLMGTTLNSSGALASRFAGRTIPAHAVDSMNIELRDNASASAATIRKYRPAWLLADGSIRDFADTTKRYVEFDISAGDYFLVPRHRNHLAVMSAVSQPLNGATPPAFDFSTSMSQAYGVNALKQIGATFVAFAGDANQSGIVSSADANSVFGFFNVTGYREEDVNLTGIVSAADANAVFGNLGAASRVP